MAILSIRECKNRLYTELSLKFKNEQFNEPEIEEVMQALINCIRWTGLRRAILQVENEDFSIVDEIQTDSNFCSDFMELEEIIERIENTSGLSKEMSEFSLEVITTTVSRFNSVSKIEPVSIENFGTIRVEENNQYLISLAEELRVAPSVGVSIGRSATSGGSSSATGAAGAF